jgi:hypothetical protein
VKKVVIENVKLWGRVWNQWEGRGYKEWCKYYVHMYVHEKVRPVETIPGMR